MPDGRRGKIKAALLIILMLVDRHYGKPILEAPRANRPGIHPVARPRQPQAFRIPFSEPDARLNSFRLAAQRSSGHLVRASSEKNVQRSVTPIDVPQPPEGLPEQMKNDLEPLEGLPEADMMPAGATAVADSPSRRKGATMAMAGVTRALTDSPGAAVRSLLLACAAAKLASDGRGLETVYALGLIPVLQQALEESDIGSWTALASVSHRFFGVVSLVFGPLAASYFMVSGEATLPPAVIYPIILAGMLNPLLGVVLVNKNLAKADMGLLRTFATGYQGALGAAGVALLAYTLPDSIAPQYLFLAYTIYHFVYAWGDSFIHASRLAKAGGAEWDESIPLQYLPLGVKYPQNVWDMWRRAPPNPGAGTPYENILWRALIYNDGEKESRWTAAPSNPPTTAIAWTVSLPATAYFLLALSYVVHGAGPMQEFVGGLDYNFQGILSSMSILAVAQNNLGVFLYSLLLHKRLEQPVIWGLYGASWGLFLAYVASFAIRYPGLVPDFFTFMWPLSQLPH